MPVSDGCMGRRFGAYDFHQIVMNFQCAVSEFQSSENVKAFTLLAKISIFNQSAKGWFE